MPDTIYWTLVDSHQPPLETRAVLSPSEFEQFSAFRFPKRQKEWLLGRWAAKSLVHSLPAYQHYSLDQIEILNTLEGAPQLQLPGQARPAARLTISHSGHLALCALASGPDLRVGADLEKIELRSEAFIQDYFTPAECRIVDSFPAEIRAVLVTLIWSAKESMLKALEVGLRWDTRSVEVHGMDGLMPAAGDLGKWQKIQVGRTLAPNQIWAAWWQRRGEFILTLAGLALSQAKIKSVNLVEQKVEKRRL